MLANVKVGWISVGTQLFSVCLHLIIISIFSPLFLAVSRPISLSWCDSLLRWARSLLTFPFLLQITYISTPVQWNNGLASRWCPFEAFSLYRLTALCKVPLLWKANYPTSSQNNMWWKASKSTDKFTNKLHKFSKTKYRVRLLDHVQSIICCVSVSQELHPSRAASVGRLHHYVTRQVCPNSNTPSNATNEFEGCNILNHNFLTLTKKKKKVAGD